MISLLVRRTVVNQSTGLVFKSLNLFAKEAPQKGGKK